MVRSSTFCTPETGDFDGSFSACAFKAGDLIERGVMRRLPEGFDGHKCQECFTWSTDLPNKTWAAGSGCSPYYNTDKGSNANTKMVRYFDENRFEIFAARDIAAGEELLHTYISLEWRECFSDMNKMLDAKA